MANITKRAARKLGDRLHDGEEMSVAVLVEPKGTYGKNILSVAMMPRSTMRRQTRQAQEERASASGMAADFPAGSAVVAVTDQRVLMVESNGLTFGDTLMEVPLGSMLVGDISGTGIGRRIQFVFSDGTGVEVDSQRAQPLDELAERLGRAG